MKYCPKCGTALEDEMQFCPKCGAKVAASTTTEQAALPVPPVSVTQEAQSTPVPAKSVGKPCGCLVLVLVLFVLIIGLGIAYAPSGSSEGSPSQQEEAQPVVLCDVEQFANITSDELIALLGRPDSTREGKCNGKFDVPCTYYEYKNHKVLGWVSFVLVNNKVIKLISDKDKYECAGKDSVLERFGVKPGDKCLVTADTPIAIRYSCPSEKIDDFWYLWGDSGCSLRVTYDMMYYSEWYRGVGREEGEKYKRATEEAVKALLKAPATADFPNISEWSFGANEHYVAVGGYVDAQNSFGAKIRNEFAFVYAAGTLVPVRVVFDGKVILDEGYVPMSDRIAELTGKKKGKKKK